MAPCDACLTGPSGIEGHAGLLMQPLTARTMVFKCLNCRALWSRSYEGEGLFDWTPVAASANLRAAAD